MATIKIDMTPSYRPGFGQFTFAPTTAYVDKNDPTGVDFVLTGALATADTVVRIQFPGVSPLADEISFSFQAKGAKTRGKTTSKLNGKTGTFHYYTAVFSGGQIYVDTDCPTIIVN
jgi:hypothetical protein